MGEYDERNRFGRNGHTRRGFELIGPRKLNPLVGVAAYVHTAQERPGRLFPYGVLHTVNRALSSMVY